MAAQESRQKSRCFYVLRSDLEQFGVHCSLLSERGRTKDKANQVNTSTRTCAEAGWMQTLLQILYERRDSGVRPESSRGKWAEG